jgi:hypothetical protein
VTCRQGTAQVPQGWQKHLVAQSLIRSELPAGWLVGLFLMRSITSVRTPWVFDRRNAHVGEAQSK